MFLERLGADAAIFGAFSYYAQQGLHLARVATAQRELYQLYTETGAADAEPSGSFYHRSPNRATLPVTGHWVAARTRNDEQPLAANVDLVFLVCGLDADFNLRRLERYLALVAGSGALPVVVLNKADLCSDLAGSWQIRSRPWNASGSGKPSISRHVPLIKARR